MKEKGLLILGSKRYHELSIYDVLKKGREILLKYSKIQSTWTHPNKPAYSLKSTGNGFVLIDHSLDREITFDYCQAQALRALLKLEDTSGSTFEYFRRK